MKKIISIALILFTLNSFAQNEVKWFNDINEARTLSIKEKKPILFYFTGSDWCGYCKKLVREVFKKEAFKIWAKENVILMIVDFPRKKLDQKTITQNKKLQNNFQNKFGMPIGGYPTIWYAYPNEKDIHKFKKIGYRSTGYGDAMVGGVDGWINVSNQILGKK